jgi:TolB-like protein/DNA-binding winged helix-turn-helix (wHTH) protein/Flp pilus assembly protein TadD
METKPAYDFGPFRLDAEARILFKEGTIVSLTPKVVELLLVLIERDGQVISKDELLRTVWPDTFVEESNLSSNISILRKQLGARPEGGDYIETIPKRGYRFVAPVTKAPRSKPLFAGRKRALLLWLTLSAATGASLVLLTMALKQWGMLSGLVAATPMNTRLAVLPLTNLSGDPSQEYFADGITEALTADLAQIGSLDVTSRSSAMQYKNTKTPLPEIARRLHVEAVITGSVTRSGGRVRIIAELTHATTERRLWTRTYERSLTDILDLQSEVARAIAGEVQAELTPRELGRLARNRAVTSDAYEAYLKGRHYWNQYSADAMWKSLGYFDQATKLDPGYAEAFAGMADAWLLLEHMGAAVPEDAHPKALQAASTALRIDKDLAEAHCSMASVRAHEWDWDAAERECLKAFALNPHYSLSYSRYSNQLRHRGHGEESITQAKRAVELDPLSPWANSALGDAYRSARQYDLAIGQYQKTLDLFPDQSVPRDSLGWCYVYKGMYERGMQEIHKSGEDPEISPELAFVEAMRGNKAKAEQVLKRLLSMSQSAQVAPHHFALIYAGLERTDDALASLEKAYQQHSSMMYWLKVDPRFDRLRPDPRFQDLMHRVGL